MTHDYTFRTYIANGREYYEYSVDALTWLERSELESNCQLTLIKKDFPFPENLLSLLYLDTDKLDLLVKRIDKAIREFLPTKDERYVHEALEGLDEMAHVHVYFELVRLEWQWRFAELKEWGYENRSESLPRKRITHIPVIIGEVQRQIIDLFDHALNMDGEQGHIQHTDVRLSLLGDNPPLLQDFLIVAAQPVDALDNQQVAPFQFFHHLLIGRAVEVFPGLFVHVDVLLWNRLPQGDELACLVLLLGGYPYIAVSCSFQ